MYVCVWQRVASGAHLGPSSRAPALTSGTESAKVGRRPNRWHLTFDWTQIIAAQRSRYVVTMLNNSKSL